MRNGLQFVITFLGMFLLLLVSCKKDDAGKKANTAKPLISSFTITSVTMNTATINYNVSNYTSLKVVIDGVETVVSGGSHTVSNLTANKYYTITLIATNQNGAVSSAQNFTTLKSSLAITNYKVIDSTESGATFNFAANSNATITSQSLTNNATGEVIDVLGKTDHSVSNLNPNTSYTFTFKVKDNTGNEISSNITFKTKEKVSNWISFTDIEYANPFAIIANAVSNKLIIKVNNNAGGMKAFPSFKVNFGGNAKAVKMLRYKLNGASWVRVNPDNANEFTISNTTLITGENVFEIYFSLKVNVGVADNAPLSFTITNMNDGEGGTLPIGGSFPATIGVGSVNASTQATVITTDWIGDMYGNSIWMGPKSNNPNGNFSESGFYQAINIKATGPAGARFHSIRLKNPYSAFTGLEFDNSSWVFANMTVYSYAKIVNNLWQGEYITLTLSSEANSNYFTTDGINYNHFYIKCSIRNNSDVIFDTGNYTPGYHGFMLTSKYDLVIKNSDGQVIDLSDVRVWQGNSILTN